MNTKKRVLSLIFTLILCISVPFSAFANVAPNVNQDIKYYEDGSYVITEVENGISVFSSGSKTQSKTSTYYDRDGERQWSVTLKSSFTYTGSSATCTSASVSYNIYDSAWKVKEANASRSGRTATGEFLVKKYWLGIITNTVPITIITTCDNNGNIT